LGRTQNAILNPILRSSNAVETILVATLTLKRRRFRLPAHATHYVETAK
jgi:hypothetical protein